MSTSSKIEWTETTWNPVLGCDRVSPGCDRCYAITQARIRSANPAPVVAAAFAGLTEHRDGRLDWTGRVNLLPERLSQPLRWRKPRRVFVNSLADLFHDAVPDEFIDRVFAVMADTPQHTYQLLTKRHARMRSYLTRTWPDPLPNVWCGVSVEDEKWADIRIPALLDTPAAVRWLSCEPLLGPLRIRASLMVGMACDPPDGIGWVVAGGESGPGSRPMHPDWARLLRDQCQESGVPFFFKQWGHWGDLAPLDGNGVLDYRKAHSVANDGTVYAGDDLAYPDGPRYGEAIRAGHDRAHLTYMFPLGKGRTGRELDGRTWNEYPQSLTTAAA